MIGAPRACLRQRQLDATREAIRVAAIDLVADRGFSTVSVQHISEAAGVSPRTFFNHFRSKDEALVPDIADFTDQQRRTFLDATDVDLLTALEHLLTDHVLGSLDLTGPGGATCTAARLAQTNLDLLPRMLSVFEAFKHRVADLVAQRTGTGPDDLSCVVTADVALVTARAAIHRWSRDPEHLDLPTTLRDAYSALRDLAPAGSTPSPA